MNPIRNFITTATSPAADDFAVLDGVTNGTRKILLNGFLVANYQPLDADLTAIAALTTSGALHRTAANTYAARTLTGTASQVTVTNGDGVSGNPTLSLPTAITGVNSLTSAAATNLTLGTGTFGTAVTVMSATGNVGIGTTGPAYKLDVNGTVSSVLFRAFPSSGVYGAYFGNDNSSSWIGYNQYISPPGTWAQDNTAGASSMLYQDASGFNFFTRAAAAPAGAGTSKMTVLNNGNVTFASTTASTSTTTGSATFGGGIGVAGAGYFGGALLSTSATGGIGYTTGAGGTVTQATSRTTGVTLNTVTGSITLVSDAGSTSWQSFTVTNSAVGINDVVRVTQRSGTDLNQIHVTATAAGSFRITFATTGGTTTEQPVFNFSVIKGSTN